MQPDISWCPTPDCGYIFIFDKETSPSTFPCPVCKKIYCLNCKMSMMDGSNHKGRTCEEWKAYEDQLIREEEERRRIAL